MFLFRSFVPPLFSSLLCFFYVLSSLFFSLDLFCVVLFLLCDATASLEFCCNLCCFASLHLPRRGLCCFRCCLSCWISCFSSWLVVCASRFRCCHFVVNLVGGACGQGQPGGVRKFFGFFRIGVFGRKQVLPSGSRFVSHCFGFDIGHGKGQKTLAFSFLSRETL